MKTLVLSLFWHDGSPERKIVFPVDITKVQSDLYKIFIPIYALQSARYNDGYKIVTLTGIEIELDTQYLQVLLIIFVLWNVLTVFSRNRQRPLKPFYSKSNRFAHRAD